MLELALVILLATTPPAPAPTIDNDGAIRIETAGRLDMRIKLPSTVPKRESRSVDPRVIHSFVSGSEFGNIEFTSVSLDYRGTPIPPGRYRLVYQLQPFLKDHLDTSEYRDFLVLRDDSADLSRHPLVLALVPPRKAVTAPPQLRFIDGGSVLEFTAAEERVALRLRDGPVDARLATGVVGW